MNVRSNNNRLSLSVAFSLLAHLLVFFSIGLFIQFQLQKPQEAKIEVLEVRLAQPAPVKKQPDSSKTILTSKAPAEFKIAQTKVKNLPEQPPIPNPPVTEPPSAATGAIEGIAFPGAITTPIEGSTRSMSSLFHPRTAQQDAARTYYQQAMEAQARQQSAQQAQIIMLQLQQFLSKQLDVQPLVKGKCKLVESADGVNNRLKCDSSALYEVVSNEQRNIAAMLIALRGLGRPFSGFSAEINADKPNIILINE